MSRFFGMMAPTTNLVCISAYVALLAAASAQGAAVNRGSCKDIPNWKDIQSYSEKDKVQLEGIAYEALWFSQGQIPDTASAWKKLYNCDGYSPPVIPTSDPVFLQRGEVECSGILKWRGGKAYRAMDKVQLNGVVYEAKFWADKNPVDESKKKWGGEWKEIGPCSGDPTTAAARTKTSNPDKEPCVGVPVWEQEQKVHFVKGQQAQLDGVLYEAKWWTTENPAIASQDPYGSWKRVGPCDDSTVVPTIPTANPTASPTTITKYTPYVPPKRVVAAYYTNWAQYRRKPFLPENMNATRLTHILYAFGFIEENLTLTPFEWNDIRKDVDYTEGMYYRVQKLAKQQNPNCKVLLSLGGWNFSKGTGPGNKKWTKDVFPNAIKPENQARFCNNILNFVREHHFDGIDFDWEYPSNVEPGYPNQEVQRDQYTALVRTCRQTFDDEGKKTSRTPLIFTTATWANHNKIAETYDVPKISQYFDHIFVMTYDLYGAWDPVARPHTALFPPPALPKESGLESQMFSVERSAKAWVAQGCPPEKVVLGLASYGRCFYLEDANLPLSQTNLNAKCLVEDVPVGTFTNEKGMLASYEIEAFGEEVQSSTLYESITHTTVVQWKKDGKHGWCAYDTPATLTEKIEKLVKPGNSPARGGVFFWAMDLDEFENKKYPLLNKASDLLWPEKSK